MLKSMLVNKDFQTWHLTGWQHSHRPIRCHVRKYFLINMYFNRYFCNPGPRIYFLSVQYGLSQSYTCDLFWHRLRPRWCPDRKLIFSWKCFHKLDPGCFNIHLNLVSLLDYETKSEMLTYLWYCQCIVNQQMVHNYLNAELMNCFWETWIYNCVLVMIWYWNTKWIMTKFVRSVSWSTLRRYHLRIKHFKLLAIWLFVKNNYSNMDQWVPLQKGQYCCNPFQVMQSSWYPEC